MFGLNKKKPKEIEVIEEKEVIKTLRSKHTRLLINTHIQYGIFEDVLKEVFPYEVFVIISTLKKAGYSYETELTEDFKRTKIPIYQNAYNTFEDEYRISQLNDILIKECSMKIEIIFHNLQNEYNLILF